ncbi:MAG: serine protease [Alphaproteobacteria bacterium]|nr:serine protease [Alphaproteobacteria bacterium]
MIDDLSKYGIKYPELCVDIVNFFRSNEIHSMHYKQLKQRLGDGLAAEIVKNTLDFAQHYGTKYREIDEQAIVLQPKTISRICNKLCDFNILSKIQVAGFNTMFDDEFYYAIAEIIPNTIANQKCLNNIVYGFKYIYQSYQNNVLPIFVCSKENKEQHTGSCFKVANGIVTAKHCLENKDYAQIYSIPANILNKSKILTAPKIDLLYIIPPKDAYNFDDFVEIGTGEIIDEIMVMGYPNHAGFNNFLTATTGQIAGIEKSYLCGYDLMLLTGKIKGGNSGGPVLNNKGQIIGIVTEVPDPQGDYDKFGYGLAIPSKYIRNLTEIYDEKITFVDDITTV